MTATIERTAASTPRAVAVSRGPSRPARRDNPAGVAASNLALGALSLAAAADLARLVHPMADLFVPAALAVVVVHAVCWACRRFGRGLGLAGVGSAWTAFLVATWTLFPSHTFFGIPTRGTFTAMSQALSVAAEQFRTVVPPAPSAAGFVLAALVGCAMVAFLADWAAFRLQTTVEATLPSLSLFLFSAALAQGHGTVLAVTVWLLAMLAFLLVREAGLELPTTAWFAGRRGRGQAAVLRLGAGLAVGAVAAAVIAGPHLPGATTHPLVNWRDQGSGGTGRTTGSPLVDIRSRLVEQSDVAVFTVKANRPAYWRLTALDNFDGSGWSLNDTYRRPKGTLPGSAPPGPHITAQFTISSLQSIWLPAPYVPSSYQGPNKVSYSDASASLIADQATSDGMAYRVEATEPVPSIAQLQASPPASTVLDGAGPSGSAVDPSVAHDVEGPPVSPLVASVAHAVTDGSSTSYAKALALQNWFRTNFVYDVSVAPDDGENAIVQFLRRRRGFCQQFAGTYAAMARIIGLPARVAVGFTPGELLGDGLFHVKDLHAHAWPEVWFSGIGWVAFEPTPGRGAPDDQSYTGVVPAQNADPGTGGSTAVPAAPTTTTPPLVPTPTTAAPATQPTPPAALPHDRHRVLHDLLWALLWCSPLLVLLIAPSVQLTRRRRRIERIAASPPTARVMYAWRHATAGLSEVGCQPRRSDTPAEYATRTIRSDALDAATRDAVGRLAAVVEAVSYRSGSTTAADVADAEAAGDRVVAGVSATRSRWRRVVVALDPRRLARELSEERTLERAGD